MRGPVSSGVPECIINIGSGALLTILTGFCANVSCHTAIQVSLGILSYAHSRSKIAVYPILSGFIRCRITQSLLGKLSET